MKSIDINEIDNFQLIRAKIGSLNSDIYDHINWKPENKYDFFYNIHYPIKTANYQIFLQQEEEMYRR